MEFTGGAWIGRNGGSFDKFSFKSAALCDRCNLSFNPAASSATISLSKGCWKEKPSELEIHGAVCGSQCLPVCPIKMIAAYTCVRPLKQTRPFVHCNEILTIKVEFRKICDIRYDSFPWQAGSGNVRFYISSLEFSPRRITGPPLSSISLR